MPIVLHLADSPLRYNALRRRVPGVSQKVLTTTLRTLERNGYVLRRESGTVPPQVEYSLTEQCLALLLPMRDLIQIAVEQQDDVEAARRAFDGRD